MNYTDQPFRQFVQHSGHKQWGNEMRRKIIKRFACNWKAQCSIATITNLTEADGCLQWWSRECFFSQEIKKKKSNYTNRGLAAKVAYCISFYPHTKMVQNKLASWSLWSVSNTTEFLGNSNCFYSKNPSRCSTVDAEIKVYPHGGSLHEAFKGSLFLCLEWVIIS